MHLSLMPNHFKSLITRDLRRPFLLDLKPPMTGKPGAPSFAWLVWLQVPAPTGGRGGGQPSQGSHPAHPHLGHFQIQFPTPMPLPDPRPNPVSCDNKEAQKMKSRSPSPSSGKQVRRRRGEVPSSSGPDESGDRITREQAPRGASCPELSLVLL